MGLRRAAGRGVAGRDPGSRCGVLVGWLASLDAVESVGLVGEWCLAGARAMCGCCERAKRCGASQHVERRTPGEAAERAEPQPLEPWCVGTAQLTSDAQCSFFFRKSIYIRTIYTDDSLGKAYIYGHVSSCRSCDGSWNLPGLVGRALFHHIGIVLRHDRPTAPSRRAVAHGIPPSHPTVPMQRSSLLYTADRPTRRACYDTPTTWRARGADTRAVILDLVYNYIRAREVGPGPRRGLVAPRAVRVARARGTRRARDGRVARAGGSAAARARVNASVSCVYSVQTKVNERALDDSGCYE
eukprot:COSAG02_NODE_367_length_23739_cov_16.775127_7_plen_299_part_00